MGSPQAHATLQATCSILAEVSTQQLCHASDPVASHPEDAPVCAKRPCELLHAPSFRTVFSVALLCAAAFTSLPPTIGGPAHAQAGQDGVTGCYMEGDTLFYPRGGETPDQFCQRNANLQVCDDFYSGGITVEFFDPPASSGGGSGGGGSNPSDSDDQDSDAAEESAEPTETASLEAFVEQCEGQGGVIYGGGQLSTTFCEYPGDPTATCQCWNHAEYLAPEGPPQPSASEQTYAACMGGAVALDLVCTWH